MRRIFLVLACAFLPLHALAADTDTISRRDGFTEIWQTLKRPAQQTSRASFTDLKPGDAGHLEIVFGKLRGILDDEPAFRPNDPLTLGDALVWLFRTRNIADDPDDVQLSTLPEFLQRYPVANLATEHGTHEELTREKLLRLESVLDTALREEVHEASLYAEKWHGQGTAFGESFDMNALTAAHRSFPHNTLVKVTNVRNGKSVVVRINDRGPFVKGRDMDLSLAAFLQIEDRSKGIVDVTFERLGDASVVDAPSVSSAVAPVPAVVAAPAPISACPALRPRYTAKIGKTVMSPGIPDRAPTGSPMTFTASTRLTVMAIRLPDGTTRRINETVDTGETYSFTPDKAGNYMLIVKGDGAGRKAVRMKAAVCPTR
jgi:rare lipoprotein A